MKLGATLAVAASVFSLNTQAQAQIPVGDWLLAECHGAGPGWDAVRLPAKQKVRVYISVKNNKPIKLVTTIDTDGHVMEGGDEFIHSSFVKLVGDLQTPISQQFVESSLQNVFKVNNGRASFTTEGSTWNSTFSEVRLVIGEGEGQEPRKVVNWTYDLEGNNRTDYSLPETCKFVNVDFIETLSR